MTGKINRLSKALGVCALSGAILAGCEVTNPGPVQDEFLALPASQQGLVNGAIRELALLNSFGSYTAKLFGREFFPGGQTGSHGFNVSEHGGYAEAGGHGTEWTRFVRARFISETAIARFTQVSAPANMLYQAYLWNGVTYRLAGMYWCDAVVTPTDPSDDTPGTFEVGVATYLQRAENALDQAMTFASGAAEMDAVRLIRSQVYMHQGDWANAASDAAAVSPGAKIEQEHSTLEESLHNYGINGNNRKPWGGWTINFTFFYDYYLETGDPRAEWFDDSSNPTNEFATASLQGYGQVPWSNTAKYGRYPDFASNVSGLGVIGNSSTTVDDVPEVYSDYGEMQLILAEARLVAGDVPGAIGFINSVRTQYQSHLDLDNDGTRFPAVDAGDNLPAYPTTVTEAEAWALLIRERKIETWIEGRHMSDELRWMEQGRTTGNTANLNAGGGAARSGDAYRPDCAAGTGGAYAIGCDGEIGWMDSPRWEVTTHPGYTPLFLDNPRSRCFDITESERERNPNVPEAASAGDRFFTAQRTWPWP